MAFICLTLLILSGITDSISERFDVVGPADPVFAGAGEDVLLACSVKQKTSVVDMRVEWYRTDLSGALVHLYEDHEDRNTEQIQLYRGRTELNHQLLQTGNASLRISAVQVSDAGLYKCLIKSISWFDDATVDVKVEAVGSPPVITVDGFDGSGGLHLQCESEGWYPEPDLEWLNSEGVKLSPESTEMHKTTDRFSVKHTVTVHQRDDKIHCRVKLRHHMLETKIIISSNMFNSCSQKTAVIIMSVSAVLCVIAGILIAVFVYKYREYSSHFQLLQRCKRHILDETAFLQNHKVYVLLDAESAHPSLIVSNDGKQVRCRNTQQNEQDGIGQFDTYLAVLGKEGFSSGCFCFEVQVKGQTVWDLGVTRESAERKGSIQINPNNGYWILGLRYEKFLTSYNSPDMFSLSVKPERVGVFVDFDKGLVSFYDVDSMSQIYTFTGQSFNEKLYPFLCFGYQMNENSTPLMICDDY